MRELPILFSGPMVRAILNTKPGVWPTEPIDASLPFKWQTRRTLDESRLKIRLLHDIHGDGPFAGTRQRAGIHHAEMNQHGAVNVEAMNGERLGVRPEEFEWVAPYAVGDRLYVRETHATVGHPDDGEVFCVYRADMHGVSALYDRGGEGDWVDIDPSVSRQFREVEFWRPSIHMPKWAARLWVTPMRVRVERVQDITPADAVAEGCGMGCCYDEKFPAPPDIFDKELRFRDQWDSLNAKRGYGWQVNPWNFVYDFMRVKP